MRITPICSDFHISAPDELHFGHFSYTGATDVPPDNSQGMNSRILTCGIQRRCPFIVDPLRSIFLARIAIRR